MLMGGIDSRFDCKFEDAVKVSYFTLASWDGQTSIISTISLRFLVLV